MIRRLARLAIVWLALSGAAGGTIRFAPTPQEPPPDVPRETQRRGLADGRNHGPLGA